MPLIMQVKSQELNALLPVYPPRPYLGWQHNAVCCPRLLGPPAQPCCFQHGLSATELEEPPLHRTSLCLYFVQTDLASNCSVLVFFHSLRSPFSLPSPGPTLTPLLHWGIITRTLGCVPALDLTPRGLKPTCRSPATPCGAHFLPTPGGYSL